MLSQNKPLHLQKVTGGLRGIPGESPVLLKHIKPCFRLRVNVDINNSNEGNINGKLTFKCGFIEHCDIRSSQCYHW